jgi:hypothetical protein
MIYPANYPQPTWQYSQDITVYPERSQMECGWTRQRRTWNSVGSSVSLEFIMDTQDFDTWMQWTYTNGYQYFDIELDRFGGTRVVEQIRFVTPVQYTYQNYDTLIVSVAGEFKV